MTGLKNKPEEYWKRVLTPEEYRILREKGTEAPGTGKLLHNKEDGMYHCKACGSELFSSDTKFDSGTGWPSFSDIANNDNIDLEDDNALFMHRVEVKCASCGSHLGHVFDDGPSPTGKRYCINSACLAFEKKGSKKLQES
jgi:peptide-methionine (R)-S-oxide reductase